MDPVPNLDELTWLFEAEPAGRFPSDNWRNEWPYGAVTFSTTRDGVAVELYVEPASDLSGVHVRDGGRFELRLDLAHVRQVQVERLHGAEELVVDFGDDVASPPVRLTLKPIVRITWGNSASWAPSED